MDRAARALAFAIVGFCAVLAGILLMILIDATLEAMGAPKIVVKLGTPAIAGGLALFVWGYFGGDK